jgi:hypothetical protein
MGWGGPGFVISIVALSYGAWLISTWIRAKHGYPVENEWFGKSTRSDLQAERKIDLLAGENAQLKAQVGRLEERIAVLERIATDPAGRTAREIEALR